MPAKHAIWKLEIQCFKHVKKVGTPEFFERLVTEIDEIVCMVYLPGCQQTYAGERKEQNPLQKTLLKYHLHKDQDLFDRAYGYIRHYY